MSMLDKLHGKIVAECKHSGEDDGYQFVSIVFTDGTVFHLDLDGDTQVCSLTGQIGDLEHPPVGYK